MPRMLINAILDRSGSMNALIGDVIGNYNAYIESLHDIKDIDVSVSLVIFDEFYQEVYINRALNNVPLLDRNVYNARGSTALLDAVNKTINSVEALGNDIPDNIVFVINTDGYENSSRETTKEALKARIERLTAERGWQFIFMGAGIDAFGEAASLGISMTNSIGGTNTGAGYYSRTASLSAATQDYANVVLGNMASGAPMASATFNLQANAIPETDATINNSAGTVTNKPKGKKVTSGTSPR